MSPEHTPERVALQGDAPSPSPPGDAAAGASARKRLTSLLDEVARALKRAVVIEASIVALTSGAAALLAGALASWAGASAPVIAAFECATLLAALVFVYVRYVRLVTRALDRPISVATWLDRAIHDRNLAPPDRIALRSAVELDGTRGRFGESIALGEAAIDRATGALTHAAAERLVRREAWDALRPRLYGLAAVSSASIVLMLLVPSHVWNAFSALERLRRLDNPLRDQPPEPRLGDIRLTYRFPAYTERPQRTVSNTNGNIHALPGTEVVIETRARQGIAQGTMLVSHASIEQGERAPIDETSKIGIEVDGQRLRATIVVGRAGRYRFQLRTTNGEILEERTGHEIALELDAPPEITLIEPAETPIEVNERDRIKIVFDARDDFGLGDVSFAWRVIGSAREGHERLTTASRGLKRHPGSVDLDLGLLSLKPGDRVAYSLEARDNDSVNGPKVGASVTREIRVYSKAAHHEQVLALQEQSLDELVHILGDSLDWLFDATEESEPYKRLLDACDAIVERSTQADDLLRRTVAAVRKDPLGRKAVGDAFEAARTQLVRDARKKRTALTGARRAFGVKRAPERESARAVRRSQDTMIASLERNVVYLADLLNDQRLIDAEGLARELREQQQALKRALADYKSAPDDEKRKLIAKAIDEIKSRIQELMQELAKMRGSIPQDFVNADALRTRDAQEGIERIQRMIEEGDLEGAMAELERMLSQTEKMLSELEGGRQELESREYGEITELARKLWDDLEGVERDQRELAKKTERMSKDVLERMKARVGDPSSFVEKQKRRLEQAAQALERARPGSHMTDGDLHDQAAARIEDGMRALEARDFGAAKEMVGNALEHVEQLEQDAMRRAEQARRFGDLFSNGRSAERAEKELRRARPMLDEVLRDIEKLMPSPDSLLSNEERAQLGRQRERQAGIREQADRVGEELDKLGRELPIVGPEMKAIVGEASSAMGQAGDSMGQGDAPSALNQQRRAMDALGRLKQELQKMGNPGQGGSGGGVPLPFGQPQGSGGEAADGHDPTAMEKVEIPKPDQYKAPAEFREDILEAAKQGTVEDYREAVRRYYEELVK